MVIQENKESFLESLLFRFMTTAVFVLVRVLLLHIKSTKHKTAKMTIITKQPNAAVILTVKGPMI